MSKVLLLVVVAVAVFMQVSPSTLRLIESDEPIKPQEDFQIGFPTENSVLIYTEAVAIEGVEDEFVTTSVGWSGNHRITRVVATDQDDTGGGYVSSYTGGIGQTNVVLYFRSSAAGAPINFIVRVYGEPQAPNDLTLGFFTERTTLVHEEVIDVPGDAEGLVTTLTTHTSEGFISVVQAIDQNTEGFGGQVIRIEGELHEQTITLHFSATSPGYGIQFIVRFYVEAITGNNFMLGILTPGSILGHTERISIEAGESGESVTGTLEFEGSRVIRRIEAIDQNIFGRGGYVLDIGGGISSTSLTIHFRSVAGGSIDFLVNIYEEGDNNFILGDSTSTSVLLEMRHITVSASPNQIQQYDFDFAGAQYGEHYITMIQALDQTPDGTGGSVQLIDGGLNAHHALMRFVSTVGEDIDFLVMVYGVSSVGANDYRVGDLEPGNVLIHRAIFSMESLTNDILSGSIHYEGSRVITMIQGFDQHRDGEGGSMTNTIKNPTDVTSQFVASGPGLPIRFIIEVYGV